MQQYKYQCITLPNHVRAHTWIANHASVKDDLACDASLGAKRITFDYGAIFQYQLCLWSNWTQNIHCTGYNAISPLASTKAVHNLGTVPAAQSMARDEVAVRTCCIGSRLHILGRHRRPPRSFICTRHSSVHRFQSAKRRLRNCREACEKHEPVAARGRAAVGCTRTVADCLH